MEAKEVITLLKQKSNTNHLAGMKRFGIEDESALGIPIPELRKLARVIKNNHDLALELWKTGVHEARILASMIDDPKQVTVEQIDDWTKNFNSWDMCDQVCGNLFDRTPFVIEKAFEFSARKEEFVKRTGFVLMAEYSIHNKTAKDEVFISFLPVIEREAWDERNFVKKAVNWALRQIGKRNDVLMPAAIECTNRILLQDTRAAKWIASNALAEFKAKEAINNR